MTRAVEDSPSPLRSGGRLPAHPTCPFCDGGETELVSAFGSHASVATYWCRHCRSPFEVLKWRGPAASGGEPGEGEAGPERGP